MEQRLANTWHMSINEQNFIETALLSNLRVDNRLPYDYRDLTIKFGREDGSSEVLLGQTHIMGFVTAHLVQPYRDRPNEGSLAIYTEFSPMADPTFETGPPAESAVELGRIIDRGLRESRAVDTESLCVLAGRSVWSIRVDLHILDNGGNLVDAANVAALAALMTFRRPDCTLGGEDGLEVIVHPPLVREPLPLIVHHLPIAVTFAFITDKSIAVVDPTYYEEAVMKGRMIVTLNANEDVCSIQKAGGVGLNQTVVMQCLRIAAVKAADITNNIKDAVESYNKERSVREINRLCSLEVLDINSPYSGMRVGNKQSTSDITESRHHASQACGMSKHNDKEVEDQSTRGMAGATDNRARSSIRGPSCWDPYSKGVDSGLLKASLSSRGNTICDKKNEQIAERHLVEGTSGGGQREKKNPLPVSSGASGVAFNSSTIKTLKDAVKPKNNRKKKVSSTVTTR